ncbi:MAG TPA: hypothetical protein VD694_04475 [Nitrososphaeraceae archaeon]|nr:hypothetical protein [Nitrososphaeraceae archaeon]
MNTKERTIMNQECSSIVRMDKRIKFVGITDRNAKLLVGKSRDILSSNIIGEGVETNTNTIKSSSNMISSRVDNLFGVNFKNSNLRLFFSDYLLWTIRKCGVSSDYGKNNTDLYIFKGVGENKELAYFQVSGFTRDSVKLAVTPLDLRMRKFICIYFEPAYKIRNSVNGIDEMFEELLSKIKSNSNSSRLRIDRLRT